MSVDKILDSSTKPSSLSPFRDKSQTGCRVCAQNFEPFPRLPFALTFQTLYKKEKWGEKQIEIMILYQIHRAAHKFL